MIKMIITDAGKQAIVNSKNNGTNAVQITHIGIGSGRYIPAKTQIALKEEIKRLPISEGGSAGDNAMHVAYLDGTADFYSVYEFGVFLSDGTLFAVYSQDAVILTKNTEEIANLVVDVALEDVSVSDITFGDVTYGNTAATTENAGVIALATQAEAIAGTNTQKAVTPQGVKSALNSFETVANGGTEMRSLADHFGDKLSPKDFGAVGDGVANDTNAFTALESAITGKDVDLLGGAYIVNSKPLKNNYYNGTFIVGGNTIKPVYDFYKYGGTAERDIDVKRDFSEAQRGGAALLASNYVRQGVSGGAVVQSVAWDDVNRYMYSLHTTSADMGVINRFSTMKFGANVENTASAYTTASAYLGHQGLGVQHTGGGNIKLWASMAYETAGAAVESKGTKAVRFNAPTVANQNIDSSVEIFNLFPTVAGSNQATTICVSYSGKYLIAKYSVNGTNNYRIRIFKLEDLTVAGDYSNRFIHEFTITLTRDTDTGGIEKALQGMACDDRYIYFLSGTYGYANKHSIYISDMFGNVVDEYRDVSIGKEIGLQVGTTYYEPESLFFMSLNGQKKLVMQIATGDTTGNRLLHLVALNVRQSYYFPVGSDYGNFHAVAIDEQARIVNAEGNANFSVYPSGLSANYTARRGANQTLQARFSDDTAGNAYVFYKSRGTKVGESLSVQAGDIIGQIHFMADNGNIDYNGTIQGARAAYIEGGVFESSTITASGNTNVGVRGYMRLYVCSDANSRSGEGIEILDNGLRPTADNTHNLGTAGRRWKAVYAMTDVISTSDESTKQDVIEIPDNVLQAWANVDFKQFRFIADVEQSGENAEKYFGVIAQDILSAFEAAGLDACEYGLISKEVQEDGSILYGVRYREAMVLEAELKRKYGGGGGGGSGSVNSVNGQSPNATGAVTVYADDISLTSGNTVEYYLTNGNDITGTFGRGDGVSDNKLGDSIAALWEAVRDTGRTVTVTAADVSTSSGSNVQNELDTLSSSVQSVQTTANNAQATANTAVDNASTAQQRAEDAYSLAESAYGLGEYLNNNAVTTINSVQTGPDAVINAETLPISQNDNTTIAEKLNNAVGFPDWSTVSQQINLAGMNTVYTASSDGWLVIVDSFSITDEYGTDTLYINDTEVAKWVLSSADMVNGGQDYHTFMIPVKSGDTFKITSTGSHHYYNAKLYPFKSN